MARRVLTMLVAALVAAGCVVAGIWQWTRHEDRSALAHLVASNYDAEPRPAAQVLDPALAADDVWRPVVLSGRYVGEPVLLRGRPVDGSPAVQDLGLVEVTTGPLAGSTLVVSRGWLGLTPDEGVPPLPPRPQGVVEVVARLRTLETPSDRTGRPGDAYRVATADLARAGMGAGLGDALPAYGVVVSEDGAPPAGLSPLPRPEVTLGINLSYAIQWWLFAIGALVGGVLLLRQPSAPADDDASTDAAGPGPGPAGGPQARRPAARRRPTAEDEEDAILDAREAAAAAAAADDRRAGR